MSKGNVENGLSDLLNFAHLVDEGVILNKDGAFLVMVRFMGKDCHSIGSAELDAIASHFNRMVTLLEDGWMLHVDEIRLPSIAYPKEGAFPDPVSRLIDKAQRKRYEQEGAHFENIQLLTFVWKFPLSLVKKTKHWFVEGLPNEPDDANLTQLLQQFLETVERVIGLLSLDFFLKKLNSQELLECLNLCISGQVATLEVPPQGCFIDVALGRTPVRGGYLPQIGDQLLYVISLLGYLNSSTVPGILEALTHYPLVYRWSNRFIPLSTLTAEREMKRYQKNWNNKVKGFVGLVKEALFSQTSNQVNYDALNMTCEIDEALTLNSSHETRWGYWTSVLVLFHEDMAVLEEAKKHLTRVILQAGFTCMKEDMNAMDAWLGTIPGHGSCNARRLFINSLQLAHMLPLHTTWTGEAFSSRSSLLPSQSPPVFYAVTTGHTPFRFQLDVEDVGHQLVLGPTGAGKSTYLDFLIAQFLRYEGAQIYVFDKDYSHAALTYALEGQHYALGQTQKPWFSPLRDLSTPAKKIRAKLLIEDLISLQQITVTADIRQCIHTTIERLSDYQGDSRSLTIFCNEVQQELVRNAIRYYTLEGQFPLLDATEDCLALGRLQTFEMSWLLTQKPEIYVPVLRYLFDKIDERLDAAQGKVPTLIIVEEAWLYITHAVFSQKLKDWLKTLRKKNARVVFATQSLADLYDATTQSLTATTATLLESCPTRLYLPNPSMDPEIEQLYKKMGLSERHIDIIAKAIPKQDYYVVTPVGERLIELGLNDPQSPILSFIGLSKAKGQALIDCKARYGKAWLSHWLNDETIKAGSVG